MAAKLMERELHMLRRLVEAVIPEGTTLAGGDERTVARMRAYLEALPTAALGGYRSGLWALDAWSLPLELRPFSSLGVEKRRALLQRWENNRSHVRRMALRMLLTPIKLMHFDREEMFEQVGCRFRWPQVKDEQPRWLQQIHNGREIDEDMTLECEVAVIGTGAGGAAAAFELARRGRAVLMIEEGDFHRRSSFSGRATKAYKEMYRDQGLTASFGNVTIPLWIGRTVGGTTAINSGTCYRGPEDTFQYWRERHGLPEVFSTAGLAPYYEQVEAMLEVAPADPKYVGKVGEVIARGADRLGYQHSVLSRNAPDCDGQGVCCMGCPTGAKRSTDISYVPAALMRGAQLLTATRVNRVDIVAGRARGLSATFRSGRKLTVVADAVVVACGTLMTPQLLRRSEACNSPLLGKNLSVHPATKVIATFDERIDMSSAIPQGYAMDHFRRSDGLLFEGGSLPLDLAALAIPWTGHRFMELMERYPHMATFGFLVKDHSRGAVYNGPGGRPIIRYSLGKRDVALLQKGMGILCELFQAAGARRVLPMLVGHDEVNTPQELQRLRKAKLRAGDFEISAFHPLGTCRIGSDAKRSCIGHDHQAHDVAGLYVCDGSALPSSLGVNPQLTIMAMALRAAELIDQQLA